MKQYTRQEYIFKWNAPKDCYGTEMPKAKKKPITRCRACGVPVETSKGGPYCKDHKDLRGYV